MCVLSLLILVFSYTRLLHLNALLLYVYDWTELNWLLLFDLCKPAKLVSGPCVVFI